MLCDPPSHKFGDGPALRTSGHQCRFDQSKQTPPNLHSTFESIFQDIARLSNVQSLLESCEMPILSVARNSHVAAPQGARNRLQSTQSTKLAINQLSKGVLGGAIPFDCAKPFAARRTASLGATADSADLEHSDEL